MPKRLLLLLIPLTAAAVVVFVGVGESAEPGAERSAREDAARRLDSFVPPPGAEEVGSTGTEIDDFGPEGAEDPRFVAADRLWVSPEPVSRVIHWLRGAAPAGSGLYSTGGSAMSVRTSREPDAYWQFGYWWPDQKGVDEERKLEVTITRHGDGTAIRAETEAHWVEPRSSSERVPAGVRLVEVERELLRGGAEPRPTGIVERGLIRDPTQVASLVASVNSFEIVQPASHTCTIEKPRRLLRVKFLRAAGARPLAVAALDWPFGGCSIFSLEIEGKPQRPLSEGWIFHRRLRGALENLAPSGG